MDDKRLRLTEVLVITGVAQNTIHNWEKAGNFPKRLRHGKFIFWLESEINAWQQAQVDNR